MIDWPGLYALETVGEIDRAIHMLYETLVSFDEEPDYISIDAVLSEVDVTKLSTTLLIACLSGACSVSHGLKNFVPLLAKVKIELAARGETPERVEALTRGFDEPPTIRICSRKPVE